MNTRLQIICDLCKCMQTKVVKDKVVIAKDVIPPAGWITVEINGRKDICSDCLTVIKTILLKGDS